MDSSGPTPDPPEPRLLHPSCASSSGVASEVLLSAESFGWFKLKNSKQKAVYTTIIQNIIPFQSVQDFFTKSWGVGWLGFQTRDGLPDLANGLDGLEDSSINPFDFKFDNRKMNYRKRFVRDIFFDIVFLLLAFSEYLLRLSHLPGALVLHRQFQHPKPDNCKN